MESARTTTSAVSLTPLATELEISCFFPGIPGFFYHSWSQDTWVIDEFSDRCFDYTGITAQHLARGGGCAFRDLIHPGDREKVRSQVQECLQRQVPFQLDYRILLPDRGERWFLEWGCGTYGEQGERLRHSGFITDITDNQYRWHDLVCSERKYRRLFDASPDAVALIDRQGCVAEVNPAALRLFGCSQPEQLLSRPFAAFSPELQSDCRRSSDAAAVEISDALRKGVHAFDWLVLRSDSGEIFETAISMVRVELDQGEASLLARFQDLRCLRPDADRLRRLAFKDSLTGMPNRPAAVEWLEQQLQLHPEEPLLVLNIDIDNFQWVNNTFGRSQADAVIVIFGEVLGEQAKPDDLVARLQSDEFLVIIRRPVLRDMHWQASGHEALLQEMRLSINQALEQRLDLPYVPTYCIGSTLTHDQDFTGAEPTSLDPEQLLQEVNTALGEARRRGVNRQAQYDPEMSRSIQRRLELEAKLSQAHQLREFSVFYQPIVRRDGVIVAAEALMRWPQPDGAFISPGLFVPLLEKTGKIREVGQWLIESTCEQMARWREQGLYLEYLSINISAAQLLSKEVPLHHQLLTAIEQYHLSADALQLEITETAVLENLQLAKLELERFADSGFSISLDDFGTGYSSLLTLLQLPINGLKIDKNFIDGINRDAKSYALVEACMSMADKLGLRCIAEGIESELQCQKLQRIGCNYFQGYLFDKPLPGPDIESRLWRQRGAAGWPS